MTEINTTEEMPREPVSAVEQWLKLIYEQGEGGGGGGVTPEQVQEMINTSLTSYSTTEQMNAAIAASEVFRKETAYDELGGFDVTAASMSEQDIETAGGTPVDLEHSVVESEGAYYIGVASTIDDGQGGSTTTLEAYPVTRRKNMLDEWLYTVETDYMTYVSLYHGLWEPPEVAVTFTRIDSDLTHVEFYQPNPYATTAYELRDVSSDVPSTAGELANKDYVDAAIDAKFGEIANASY